MRSISRNSKKAQSESARARTQYGTTLLAAENDLRMEKRASHTSGDRDQIALAGEHFDLRGAGDIQEIHGAAGTDASDGGFVGSDGWEVRKEFARMDKEFFGLRNIPPFHSAILFLWKRITPVGMTVFGQRLHGVGFVEREFGNAGAAEGFQVASAAQGFAHVVRDGTHVRARGDSGAETCTAGLGFKNFEFLYFDLNRLQHDLFLLPCKFVGWNAMNFLGGKRRRHLLNYAAKAGSHGFYLFPFDGDILWIGGGRALGIVSIGRESESDCALIRLL